MSAASGVVAQRLNGASIESCYDEGEARREWGECQELAGQGEVTDCRETCAEDRLMPSRERRLSWSSGSPRRNPSAGPSETRR